MESNDLSSKRPLRIVFQCNAFLPDVIGGIEVFAAHFLPRLMARGHQVLVITSSVGGQPQGRTSYDGIDILKLNFVEALMDRQIATTLRLGHNVDRAMAEFAPDVLHINDTNTPSFFFLRQRAIKNLPRMLTLHSPIRQAGSDGLQTRLFREADYIVAVSNAVGADAIAHTPAIGEKLIVIPKRASDAGIGTDRVALRAAGPALPGQGLSRTRGSTSPSGPLPWRGNAIPVRNSSFPGMALKGCDSKRWSES